MDILVGKNLPKEVEEIVGFEHLHQHTHYSLLDGYANCEELCCRAKKNNQKFLSVSDHGMMAAVPNQIETCEKNGLSPIFSCELYVNPLQPQTKQGETTGQIISDWDDLEKKRMRKSYHLLAIAYNEKGYENLVKLSSWAWIHGYYYRPRVNYDQINKHKEGIIFTSCCYNSEIGQAFDEGGEEAGFQMVEKYKDMFGDKFYLEIMLLDFKKQKPYNEFIIKAHQKYHLPIICTNDVHYAEKDDSYMQRLMLMVNNGKTIKDIENALRENEMADLFELQDTNLWMKSEEELNLKWYEDYKDSIDYEIFKQSKINTVKICEMAKGIELDRSVKLPKVTDDNEVLKENIIKGFKYRNLPDTPEYLNRIKEEYDLIVEKDFSSYFLITQMMTDEARRFWSEDLKMGNPSDAVGPGRGSCCGSLICYCLRITDVDPIKHDLLFSRFLNPARGGKIPKFRFSKSPIKRFA